MDELFNADVIDVELLYDNAMLAVNYQFANRFGIKTILSGMNTSTEGMQMPTNWNWFKYDQRHIKYFKSKIKQSIKSTFPSIGTNEFLYYTYVKKIKWEHFLDFFNYKKEDSLQELEKNYGYKRYPYKHYESVFTRFYQGYILPKKFGVDKRKLHLSTLIVTGQATREECAIILENAPYDEFELIQDINKDIFVRFANELEKINCANKENIEIFIKEFLTSNNLKFPELGKPLRIILTGKINAPSISDLIYLLGGNLCQKRLENFLNIH